MERVRLNRHVRKSSSPYSSASDDEKILRNWTKTRGLFVRREYSVAVLRAATCMELLANYAIRRELIEERELAPTFVNRLLRSANGIHGKYQNLLLPIFEGYEEHAILKSLWKDHIAHVNKERNAVAHSGEFKSKKVAAKTLNHTMIVLREILQLYESTVEVKEFET